MTSQSAPGQLSGTQLVHGDHGPGSEVAPSISVTTTFRAVPDGGAMDHIYSRYSQNVSSRVEQILSKINQGHAITYASGLAAAFSVLVHYKPKRIAISEGYMGCHSTISIYIKGRSADIPIIDLDDEFQEGDLCWLENPLNPIGESRQVFKLALFAYTRDLDPGQKHKILRGQGTKYFGGHSDLLCGIVIVRTEAECKEVSVIELTNQPRLIVVSSASGTEIAQWLSKAVIPEGQEYDGIPGGVIAKVWHSSLQETDARGFNPSVQMEGGFNACFSILLSKTEYAEKLPHSLEYFVPATSLGGVESLVQQRMQSDPKQNGHLVRLSIGVEEVGDLKDDLRRALIQISKGN
ncbi:hypothetical protein AZE42_09726 [Rhizopogon vesiculosus]|uniref:Cystathionine gamma-synthase n=1 Tax=Rhizopogon vesiculosus TaxID=180088 RepID=A0A1J8QIZ9_9AGAM|nr:hypothetical protein AZE42_09726 [Rhizopogon vesiculosus]